MLNGYVLSLQKRAAVVFITKMEGNEAKNEGLCLKCAKELKIPNVDMMMNQLGINDDEIDNISDQMEDMFSQMGDEDFTPGGAPSMGVFQPTDVRYQSRCRCGVGRL